MEADSLVAARKIRQPIETKDDIANAFDGITYQKGASVIRMFESWVGEKKFQAGVTAYLKRYSYKNARAGDFLDTIAATGQPQLTRAFSTYLEQPGFPVISATLNCSAAPALSLTQKRYLPTGSAGNASQVWQTPVCVRYQTAKGDQKECFLLDKPAARFRLTRATACPANLSANADAAGNYITRYDSALLAKLLAGDYLNTAERMTMLNDLTSLLNAGEIPQADVLAAAAAFAQAPERQIVALAQGVVFETRRFLPTGLLPNYARFVQQTFGARADRLGWSAKPGEDSDTAFQRVSIVPFVASQGDSPALRDQARRLAAEWLKTRQGIDPNMVDPVLTNAAQFADRALFDTMTAELAKTTDRQQRSRIIGAMASFHDPAIARAAMDMVIHSAIDIRESLSLLVGPLSARETQKLPSRSSRPITTNSSSTCPAVAGWMPEPSSPSSAPALATLRRARSSSPSSKNAPKSLPAASTTTLRCWRASASAKRRNPLAPPISPLSSPNSNVAQALLPAASALLPTLAAPARKRRRVRLDAARRSACATLN